MHFKILGTFFCLLLEGGCEFQNVELLLTVHSWRINDDSDPAGSAQDKLVIREAESRYACFSVCFSYDGSYILTGVGDGCVYIYDRHTDKCTLQVSGD